MMVYFGRRTIDYHLANIAHTCAGTAFDRGRATFREVDLSSAALV